MADGLFLQQWQIAVEICAELLKQTVPAGMNQAPRTLSYNPAENAVLLTSDVDGGSYELYNIPKDSRGDAAPVSCWWCMCV